MTPISTERKYQFQMENAVSGQIKEERGKRVVGIQKPPLKRRTKWRVDSFWML